jgi:uncharacterized protein
VEKVHARMMEIFHQPEFYLLLCAAFLAGCIDAIVGGGGLIQLPAFFLAFPGLPQAVILGSNKFAGFAGTVLATYRYIKTTPVRWREVLPAVITALISAAFGASLVSHFDKNLFKPLVLILLIAVAVYTFLKKDFGLQQEAKLKQKQFLMASLVTGIVIGFYDGFFGPGTGSFLIVIYISLFGFDFLNASVSAKLINCASNVAALAYFIAEGSIRFEIAIPVAIFNMAGSFFGVRMALLKGNRFIRILFLVVVTAMVLKFGWEVLGK